MPKIGMIFDCDGTLVDSLGQALDSFNFALNKIGRPARTIDEIKRFFGSAADRIFLKLLDDEELALRAFEHYLEHQSELAKTMKLHSGIRTLLEKLSAAGAPMAVVTGRHARDLEVVLRPHHVHDFFQTMIADSHLPKSKPAPDGILLAAKRLGIDPSECCYVGDSVIDVQAARNAGAIAVAALWDAVARPNEMIPHQPAVLARSPEEVWLAYRELANF